MKTRMTTLRLFVALLFAAALSVQTVHAATITVNSTTDPTESGKTTLRDALAAASDGDMIDFSVTTPATITLNSGQLEVSKSITINGPDANLLTVDANHASRVFLIDAGTTVTISGLTITNGSASGIFFDNSGAGIYNNHATLTVTNSTLSGNSAAGLGGGIFSDAQVGSATLTVGNSTLSGNSALDGGGIYNDGFMGSATLTVTNSTLSGNSAVLDGGGIVNNTGLIGGSGATLTVSNSTLSGNSAGGVSLGGGGIFNGFGLTLTIGSTILNAGASGANIFNEGTVMSLGYNLSSDDASALLNQSTDQNSTNPLLGALANNGGPTFTHALLTGSPAIDKGKNFTTATTDQRGFFRTFDNFSIPNATGGDGTDIGAFEVQSTVCPQGQGFWKNNPAAWPASALPMTLGSQTYTTKSQLLKILKTPIKGNAVLILADQLIAAKLNIANANGTPVASTVMDADSLLTGHPIGSHVKTSTSTGQAMVNDANVLDNYNNGVMTPGCTP